MSIGTLNIDAAGTAMFVALQHGIRRKDLAAVPEIPYAYQECTLSTASKKVEQSLYENKS